MLRKGEKVMPRPQKCRRVCALPKSCRFGALDGLNSSVIQMTVEEFETIRLMDLESCTQEECARQMDVARPTVQRIYASARKKLAEALVTGGTLHIGGGCYSVCNRVANCCSGCRGDTKRTFSAQCLEKGEKIMKIAVTTENGNVFQHFGKCKEFTLFDVEEQKIISKQVLSAGESGHSALAVLLAQNQVDLLICGGIGAGARVALQESGIQLAAGVSGTVDNAVNAYLNGTLFFNNEATCDHHHGESGEGHHCGEEHHCNGHCH